MYERYKVWLGLGSSLGLWAWASGLRFPGFSALPWRLGAKTSLEPKVKGSSVKLIGVTFSVP